MKKEVQDFYKAEIVTADFSESTITLLIEGDFRVKTGEYFVVSKEALQNFANDAFYDQRKICAEIYNENLGHTQPDNYLYNAILEAEQPEFPNL